MPFVRRFTHLLLGLALLGFPGLCFAANDNALSDRPAYWAEPVELSSVPNLHRVSADLYRSAQPEPEGYTALKRLGIKTVVNLRVLDSDKEEAEAAGLDYVHLKVTAWDPKDEQVVAFLKVAGDPGRTPVLVHCRHGADRTGLMSAVYRMALQGWDREEAIREMTEGGYGYHPIWSNLKSYVRELDLASIKHRAGLTSLLRSWEQTGIERILHIRKGLDDLIAYLDSRPDLFPSGPRPVTEDLFTRAERMAVWQVWQAFLDYTFTLDAVGHFYRQQPVDSYGPDRSTSFCLSWAAFLTQYRSALDVISRLERDPSLHTLLNESVPELGLSRGSYALAKFRFLNAVLGSEFLRLNATFKAHRTAMPPDLADHVADDIQALFAYGLGQGTLLTGKNAYRVIRDTLHAAWFPVQKSVSEWMGDTKVLRPDEVLISPDQIERLKAVVKPGDILLERREWYMTNLGIPGYWTHAALIVGTPRERQLFFDTPPVARWVHSRRENATDLETLLAQDFPATHTLSTTSDPQGYPYRIIEAIGEGVTLTSLEHTAHCDSIVVLRPRQPKDVRARAVYRAFLYAGRPYDYDFDFRTDSALVCTELVYKAYQPDAELPGLDLPLTEMLGRPLLPANDIARRFDQTYGTDAQQFDMVLFLDGREKAGRAEQSGLDAFRSSWKRPKWHVFVQQAADDQGSVHP